MVQRVAETPAPPPFDGGSVERDGDAPRHGGAPKGNRFCSCNQVNTVQTRAGHLDIISRAARPGYEK